MPVTVGGAKVTRQGPGPLRAPSWLFVSFVVDSIHHKGHKEARKLPRNEWYPVPFTSVGRLPSNPQRAKIPSDARSRRFSLFSSQRALPSPTSASKPVPEAKRHYFLEIFRDGCGKPASASSSTDPAFPPARSSSIIVPRSRDLRHAAGGVRLSRGAGRSTNAVRRGIPRAGGDARGGRRLSRADPFNWIRRHGGLTARPIFLHGRELAALYPACR